MRRRVGIELSWVALLALALSAACHEGEPRAIPSGTRNAAALGLWPLENALLVYPVNYERVTIDVRGARIVLSISEAKALAASLAASLAVVRQLEAADLVQRAQTAIERVELEIAAGERRIAELRWQLLQERLDCRGLTAGHCDLLRCALQSFVPHPQLESSGRHVGQRECAVTAGHRGHFVGDDDPAAHPGMGVAVQTHHSGPGDRLGDLDSRQGQGDVEEHLARGCLRIGGVQHRVAARSGDGGVRSHDLHVRREAAPLVHHPSRGRTNRPGPRSAEHVADPAARPAREREAEIRLVYEQLGRAQLALGHERVAAGRLRLGPPGLAGEVLRVGIQSALGRGLRDPEDRLVAIVDVAVALHPCPDRLPPAPVGGDGVSFQCSDACTCFQCFNEEFEYGEQCEPSLKIGCADERAFCNRRCQCILPRCDDGVLQPGDSCDDTSNPCAFEFEFCVDFGDGCFCSSFVEF